jgi:two-component system, NtrC family, response regulator GlrR
MARSVIILDEETESPIGAELRDFLQTAGGYDINLVHNVGIATSTYKKQPEQILIPVLPSIKVRAEGLIAALRNGVPGVRLLPVVRSEILSDVFDSLFLSARDFLITPLRERESCARVRWVMDSIEHRPQDQPAERVTSAVGLMPLVGEDPIFKAMKRKISLLAQSDCTILITGETGTGKELCARALHYLSSYAQHPFLPVNCGAIPIELFESELFGHQKGAFTGASTAHPGLIAEAEGGTLMLDEVEALSLKSQITLLRFLQDQTYYVVGSPRSRQANVRIVASTNIELRAKIEAGTFRQDLYQRLAVIRLDVPPLRDRASDIPLLVDHFWKIYAIRTHRPDRYLSPQSIEVMCQYSWPGNIRELQNLIQHVVLLVEADRVEPKDLPIPSHRLVVGSKPTSFRQSKVLAIEAFEKAYITESLRLHNGNVTRAAEAVHKDRRAFGRMIRKYGILKH